MGNRTKQKLGVTRLRPAYHQVADQLRELIVTGSLTPGDQLPTEPELCEAFGVSRSTVREAIRSLESQNLVHTSRGVNGGTFVANAEPRAISDYLETSIGMLSADAVTIDQMLAVREILEVPAARLAASQRTESDLEALRAEVERETSGADPRHEGPQSFHSLVLACAHNNLLEIVTQPIFSVLRSRFLRGTAPTVFWAQVGHVHQEIVAAIEDRDEDAAAAAMKEHLRHLRETYLRMDRFTQDEQE